MYRIFIFLYLCALRLAAIWNPKARLWVRGRKSVIPEMRRRFQGEHRQVVWFHCASLGEFEQGRPLIEALRESHPDICILLTFFSPSGYEACKTYAGADHILYLPMDSPGNARRFLDACSPSFAVFVKYEFWHFYLRALSGRGIPTLLVSAVFRPDQPFFRWYGGFWRNMLGAYSRIFVQDESSLTLLEDLGFGGKAVLSGDTRFDRVLEITRGAGAIAHDAGAIRHDDAAKGIPAAADFAGDGPVIVAGSTWSEDEKELAHFVRTHPDVRFILAPHEIGKDHLREIAHRFPDHVLYSEYCKKPVQAQCLVIDNIGMLSRLYQYAAITYVGGGFAGDGVHNVLEPAVWGKPVVFGPIYDKYREATELLQSGGGFTASTTLELEKCLEHLLHDPAGLEKAGRSARTYVENKAGATRRILGYIQENRLLTN